MGITFVSKKTFDNAVTREPTPGMTVMTWPSDANLFELSLDDFEDLLEFMGEVAGCDLSYMPRNDEDVEFAEEAVARQWAEQLRPHLDKFDGQDRELVEEAILFFSTCEGGFAALT